MHYRDLYASNREARILLSILTEPGDTNVGEMVKTWGLGGTLDGLLANDWNDWPSEHWLRYERSQVEAARNRLLPRLQGMRSTMRELEARWREQGIQVLTPDDAKWPSPIDDLDNAAPWCLYVMGDAQALAELTKRPSVAVVGARAATNYGEHVTTELVTHVAGEGHPIVSGAAYGIDAAAHRAALAVGGLTIAFLAGGVERAYPAGHRDLLGRITQSGGAVVSEVPPGSAPTKWRFLERNRLIAASTEASVVVEAGYRSGSLNEASHAKKLGRSVGAVPGPVTSAASAGCHRLLKEGATVITDAADVLELIGAQPVRETERILA